MAKLAIETGLWVNYEMADGVVEKAKKVRRKPVEEYLSKQKRFRHLFKPVRQDDEIARIQAIADANAARFGIDIKKKESSE
jgi:pyruvate ferredoxin oxidoreductase beta subunit